MQAVIAILAALVSRAKTGEGGYLDVAVADGVLALMSLQVDDAPRHRQRAAAGHRAAVRPICLLRHLPDRRRRLAGGRRDRGQVLGEPVPRARLEILSRDQQYDDNAQAAARAALASAFLTKSATSGSRCSQPPIPASHRSSPQPTRQQTPGSPLAVRSRPPAPLPARNGGSSRRCSPAPRARPATTCRTARPPTPTTSSPAADSPPRRSRSCATKERLSPHEIATQAPRFRRGARK